MLYDPLRYPYNGHNDPRDTMDPIKWDLDESQLETVHVEGYPYKVNRRGGTPPKERARRLHCIREFVHALAERLLNEVYSGGRTIPSDPPHPTLDQHLLFIDIHCPLYREEVLPNHFHKVRGRPHSKCLFSEICHGDRSGFEGMNKPRHRTTAYSEPHVGQDGKIRATYRDIFLDPEKVDGYFVSGGKDYGALRRLVLHEIAHTMANHVTFRWDDHGEDFKVCEAVLTDLAKGLKIGL